MVNSIRERQTDRQSSNIVWFPHLTLHIVYHIVQKETDEKKTLKSLMTFHNLKAATIQNYHLMHVYCVYFHIF